MLVQILCVGSLLASPMWASRGSQTAGPYTIWHFFAPMFTLVAIVMVIS